MGVVTDRIGRTYTFDRIRFKMDEALLQQAAIGLVDETSERAQILFDRYCSLHLSKYGRNYEPTHFASGRLIPRFQAIYEQKAQVIRVVIEVRSGDLFDRYVGQPPNAIENSVRANPREWINAAAVVLAG